MKIKKILLPILIFIASIQNTGAQVIKLGTLAPDGSPWYEVLREMGDKWKTGTNNKISFKIYPGGVIGDESDMIRKMRIGQLHAAALTGVGLARLVPEINALQLPLIFESYQEYDFVRDRLIPKFEKLLDEKGFIVLNWGDAGWVHLFSQKPVIYPENLKGQRIFVWAGETAWFNAWKAAGFHPVELSATDILPSLQTGLINAYATTPIAALSFQWFALAKNMMALPWAPLVGATVITKRKWNQIPEDIRPLLMEVAKSSGEELKEKIRELDTKAVEIMGTHGLIAHSVPPDALAEWKDLADKYIYGKFLEDMVPQEIFDEILQLCEEYRIQKNSLKGK